jgi:uncharacterized protein (DUF1015 family)
MPEIAPFRGILYDPARVEIAKVLAPPYDVINEAERQALVAREPHNVVRLDLPRDANGGETDARYTGAATLLDRWLADGILRRDDYRAIYRYHQVFRSAELGDREITRKGFVAQVRLHDFADKIILPHERTLRGPKIDRMNLMKATNAHFSQIFTMYRDPAGETERVFRKVERNAPDVDATTEDGVRHIVWRLRDHEQIGPLCRFIGPRPLYIADGHHRYETMLAMREHYAALAGGTLSPHAQPQYGTMFLANMDDPGLVVLPTHRIVHGLAELTPASMIEKAKEYFVVQMLRDGAREPARLREAIANGINHAPTFAAVFPGQADAYVLSLDPHTSPASLGLIGNSAVVKLDVTLLHALLLERVLGIDAAAQEAQTNLRYVKDTATALREIAAGEGQVAFIMNPPRLEQIRAISDAGEVMPQKSTYFYPKLASGLIMHRVEPDGEIG